MPVYLSQEEVDALDSLALEELQQNGGYLVRPRTSISSVASSVFSRVADTAAPIAQAATSYVTPPLSPADQQMADLELEQAGSQRPVPIPSFQAPWAAAPPPPPTGVAALPPIVARPSNVPYSPASISVNAVAPQIVPQVPQDYTPVPTMASGDTFQGFPGQRIALPSEQLQQGRGGILGGLQDIGAGALGALDVGREYFGNPLAGGIANAITRPNIPSTIGGALGALSGPVGIAMSAGLANLGTDYSGSRERGQQIREDAYSLDPGVGVAYDVLTDPATYIGIGAAKSASARAPRAIQPLLTGKYNPIGGLLEGVGAKGALPLALGSGAGASIAAHTNTPGLSDAAESLIYSGLGGVGALGLSSIARSGAQRAPVSAVREAGDIDPLTREILGLTDEAAPAGMRAIEPPQTYPANLADFTPEQLRSRAAEVQKALDDLDIRTERIAKSAGFNDPRIRTMEELQTRLEVESNAIWDEVGRRRPQLGNIEIAGAQKPDVALARAAEGWTPFERPETALVRQYEGALGRHGEELRRTLRLGNERLKQLGLGTQDGAYRRLSEAEGLQLTRALNMADPTGLPPGLKGVYDDVRRLYDAEEALTRAADPGFMGIEGDYTYRGWREVPISEREAFQRLGKGASIVAEASDEVPDVAAITQRAGGGFASRPNFMRQRVEATFDEINGSVRQLPDGKWVRREPISYNPYEMYVLRAEAGNRYREQLRLIDRVKAYNIGRSLQRGEPVPEGFRVPRIGPAFEGKARPFMRAPESVFDLSGAVRGVDDVPPAAAISYTPQIAVPNRMADVLEAMYGHRPTLPIGDRDVLRYITKANMALKRTKLLGSFFQQAEFSMRLQGAGFGGVIDALLAGKPLRAAATLASIPKVVVDEVWANLSPARRASLQDQMLSTKPIFKERPGLSYRSIMDAGWSHTDSSWVARGVRESTNEIRAGMSGPVTRTVKGLDRALTDGLFDGVYPTAQMYALKHQILPRIMRQHPKWSDAQIAAQAADEVNKMFSSLGSYQTVFKSPSWKALNENVFFSMNEFESLMKQGASTVKGPNKLLWAEYSLGYFLGAALVAEIVNMAVTGQPLGLDQLNPLERDPNSMVGVRYNRDFVSPAIGEFGRGGARVNLDLVQQMDTVFSFLTDPQGALESRLNVTPRALKSQWDAKDFYGRSIEKGPKGLIGRAQQLGSDLAMPIGVGNLLEAARQTVPGLKNAVPEGEGRLGPIGASIQGFGPNLRAEPTADYIDRLASEWAKANGIGATDPVTGEPTGKPVQSTADLTPRQRRAFEEANPEMVAELQRRTEQGVLTGNEAAITRGKADEAKEQYAAYQAANDDALVAGGDPGKWREVRSDIYDDLRVKTDTIYADVPDREARTALEQFYAQMDAATSADGQSVDWDKVDAWLVSQPTGVQNLINDSTGLGGTPTEQRFRVEAKLIADTGYWDIYDNLAKSYAEFRGFPATITTRDELEAYARTNIEQALASQGRVPTRAVVDDLIQRNLAEYYDKATEQREATGNQMVTVSGTQVPIWALLYKWGYKTSLNEGQRKAMESAASLPDVQQALAYR